MEAIITFALVENVHMVLTNHISHRKTKNGNSMDGNYDFLSIVEKLMFCFLSLSHSSNESLWANMNVSVPKNLFIFRCNFWYAIFSGNVTKTEISFIGSCYLKKSFSIAKIMVVFAFMNHRLFPNWSTGCKWEKGEF